MITEETDQFVISQGEVPAKGTPVEIAVNERIGEKLEDAIRHAVEHVVRRPGILLNAKETEADIVAKRTNQGTRLYIGPKLRMGIAAGAVLLVAGGVVAHELLKKNLEQKKKDDKD